MFTLSLTITAYEASMDSSSCFVASPVASYSIQLEQTQKCGEVLNVALITSVVSYHIRHDDAGA